MPPPSQLRPAPRPRPVVAARALPLFILLLAASVVSAQVTFVSAETSVLSTGLVSPSGVAADGQGNLYIADTGNNRILMLPISSHQANAQSIAPANSPVTLLTGLSSPAGLTSDWSGDLFIADTGNNQIVVLPLTSAGYAAPVYVNPGFSSPMSVAVDSSGNLYVADTGNNRVVMVPLVAGIYTAPQTIASGLDHPSSVAIDAKRDVFFADTGNNRVIEAHFSGTGYTQQNGVQYLSSPTGVYVDPNYNLFITGAGGQVVMAPWSAGAKRFNTSFAIAADLSAPGAVTTDWLGNVYVADAGNNRIRSLSGQATQFGPYPVNTTAPEQTYNFQLAAGTTIGSGAIVTQGLPGGDFTDAGSSTCALQTYASNTLCSVNVSFTPFLSGLRTGAIVFEDGFGNPLMSTYISGTGLAPQIAYLPGRQTSLITNLSGPSGLAVDAIGDVFISDTGNNRVLELPWNGAGYGSPTQLAISNLESPMGMAFDGSGALYVASNQNDSVIKLPWIPGTSGTAGSFGPQSKVGTALYGPSGVAVGANGEVYIANTLSNEVVAVPWFGNSYGQESSLGNFHRFPESVAVDAQGNVYFASPYYNQVVQIPWSQGQFQVQVNLPLNNITAPSGVVADANSNLFILNGNTGQVVMLPWTGNSYGPELTVASGFNAPTALAIDAYDNLYVADTGNNQVVKISLSTPPALSFQNTYVGLTSPDSAQTVGLLNVGNQPLPITSIAYPTDFLEGITTSPICSPGTAIAPGGACAIPINFTPQTTGAPLQESISVTTVASSNPVSIAVSGTSLALVTQTINFPTLPSITYGSGPTPLTATSSSGLPITYQILSGPGVLNARGNAVIVTGAGSVTIQASQAGSSAFTAATPLTQTLFVAPAALTVTAANSSAVYGAAFAPFTYTLSGFVAGDQPAQAVSGAASLTTQAMAGAGAGSYPITVTAGTLYAANYSFIFIPGTLTITRSLLRVVPIAATSVYGQPLPQLSAAITGFVNGDTALNTITGVPQLTSLATSQSPPGSYAINASQGSLSASNYNFAFGYASLTITRQTLTITPTPATMMYGASVPSIGYTLSGFVNGDTPAIVTGSPQFFIQANSRSTAGQYSVAASAGTLQAACYTFIGTTSTITVRKAPLLVTALNQTMTYGGAIPQLRYVISGFARGDSVATATSGTAAVSVAATAPFAAGVYALNPSIGTLSAANYIFNFAQGSLTVTKSLLTVRATPASMVYGTPLPALTYSISGFAGADTLASSVSGSPSLTSTASSSSHPGNYPVVISMGTLSSSNYAFTFVSGALTVTKALLTITPNATQMTYGASTPSLGYTLTGFVNGDTRSSVTGSPRLYAKLGAKPAVGSYPITASTGSLNSAWYTFAGATGTLTVTPAVLAVTAVSATAVYGAGLPHLTCRIAGFAQGDWASQAVTGAPQVTTSAVAGSPAGVYPIRCAAGTLNAKNYIFRFAGASLTMQRAPLLVKANNLSMTANATLPQLTYTAVGFAPGDTLQSATAGAPTLTTSATQRSRPGDYTIAIAMGSLTAENYRISLQSGKLQIVK